jgi:hypothetical protein
MEKQAAEDKKSAEWYWEEEYPLLSFEERKLIWLRTFYYSRRYTEESFGHKGPDPFTPEAIDNLRKLDPQMDEIIAYVKQEMENIWFGEA